MINHKNFKKMKKITLLKTTKPQFVFVGFTSTKEKLLYDVISREYFVFHKDTNHLRKIINLN